MINGTVGARGDGLAFNLADLVRTHAADRPRSPCLTFGDLALDFGELDSRSSRVARALARAGVAPGERVALIARNGPVHFELLYGCAKAGAVFVPLNWRLSAREVAAVLADAGPRLVFADTHYLPLVPADVRAVAGCINTEDGYAAWRDASPATDPGLRIDPHAPLALLYTSGTTGRPKGVVVSHANLSFSSRMARELWNFTDASVNLVAMPLYHIGGLGYGTMALSQGGHTVLLEQPSPLPVFDAIRRHRVTHAFFVPTVIFDLVQAAGDDRGGLQGLQLIVYGASPMSGTLLSRATELFGCRFSHAYGMTETSGTVLTLQTHDYDPRGAGEGRLLSCGKPVPWVEFGLFDPITCRPVPAGEVGEIWIRSGMNTQGYWNQPVETAATVRPDGWLRSGDAASQDSDGFVYIHDRLKDVIITGGENVFPAEVEQVLKEHPGVAEAAVIGVPHPRWGETVKAFVVAAPLTPDSVVLTEAALIEFARGRLAHFRCPSSVEMVARLPQNGSGKVLRRELRRREGRRHVDKS